jgi:hypothetical protein
MVDTQRHDYGACSAVMAEKKKLLINGCTHSVTILARVQLYTQRHDFGACSACVGMRSQFLSSCKEETDGNSGIQQEGGQ